MVVRFVTRSAEGRHSQELLTIMHKKVQYTDDYDFNHEVILVALKLRTQTPK